MYRLYIARNVASNGRQPDFHCEVSNLSPKKWAGEIKDPRLNDGRWEVVTGATIARVCSECGTLHPRATEIAEALQLMLEIDSQSSGQIPIRTTLDWLLCFAFKTGYSLGQKEKIG